MIDIKEKYNNLISDKTLNNAVMVVSIIVFVVFSMYKTLTHVPFFDEINAWNIAAYLKPSEIFEITRHEGHLFIWYFLLIPFAKNDIGFPVAMQLINWIFCLGAVLLLWFKAPFNTITKFFITFSMPIQVFYIHARCYGIGIFLLFYVCTMYKDRLKHPFLYAFLLILIGNTSLMALILAFAIGVCFLYDLAKALQEKVFSKVKILQILSICALGGFIIILQLFNHTTMYYITENLNHAESFYKIYLGFENQALNIIFAICHLGILAFAWDFFEKDKLPFAFLSITYFLLLITYFCTYNIKVWHFSFLFIILIIAIWIYLAENEITKNFQKTYINLFCIMFALLIFYPQNYIIKVKYIELSEYMKENQVFANKKIYFYPTDLSFIGITHYLKNNGNTFYDCLGNSNKSIEYYKHQWDNPTVDFQKISSTLDKGEAAFIFTDYTRLNHNYLWDIEGSYMIYQKEHDDLDVKLMDSGNIDLYIWKITKRK